MAPSVLPTRAWLDAIPDDPGKLFSSCGLAAGTRPSRLARGWIGAEERAHDGLWLPTVC
jgi:hypothetical protein